MIGIAEEEAIPHTSKPCGWESITTHGVWSAYFAHGGRQNILAQISSHGGAALGYRGIVVTTWPVTPSVRRHQGVLAHPAVMVGADSAEGQGHRSSGPIRGYRQICEEEKVLSRRRQSAR